ncbi:hypothetical protein LTR66_010340 [Elasticomyces elasticus]|nr:hypothetical protein LTR66_010340 [Elasticomyces elasticus]KAK4981095.1 hypothetical protein LTR28_006231 [Elasticomyces elasticus]
MGSLGQLHNLAVFIRASTERYQAFITRAGQTLDQDNDTRSNSSFRMLEKGIQLQRPIRNFQGEYCQQTKDDRLELEDEELLKERYNILEPFEDVTLQTQGDKVTLDSLLPSMDYLIKHIKQCQQKHAGNTNLSSSLLTCWFTFNKYHNVTDETPVYATAIALYPSLKEPFDKNWQHISRHIRPTKKKIFHFWIREYAPTEDEVAVTNENETTYQRYLAEVRCTGNVFKDQ